MRNDDVFFSLYLIRHGESMGNVETDEDFDKTNPPLTHHGNLQAQAVAERMAGVRLDAVCSSPLERALCTALPIAEKNKTQFIIDLSLCEKDICITEKASPFIMNLIPIAPQEPKNSLLSLSKNIRAVRLPLFLTVSLSSF